MFIDWGGRTVSSYWGNILPCGKSGITVKRGAVNWGFTVFEMFKPGIDGINCTSQVFG